MIFFVDVDNFFAAVELVENPQLQNQAVIITSRSRRGVVASANTAARSLGVWPGMTTDRAVRRCPQAMVLPLRRSVYEAYAEQVQTLLTDTGHPVEPLSLSEYFVDGQSEATAGPAYAHNLQSRLRAEVGLTASIGGASNKLLARLAVTTGDMAQAERRIFIAPAEETNFLAPLPLEVLPALTPKMEATLREWGWRTVGEVGQATEQRLIAAFGVAGAVLWRQAQGLDSSAVVGEQVSQSLSQERTFASDVSDPQVLRETLWQLSQNLAERLQAENLTGQSLSLKLRYADYSTLTRRSSQPATLNAAPDIHRLALFLWRTHWNPTRPVRLLGLRVSKLVVGVAQLPLFDG